MSKRKDGQAPRKYTLEFKMEACLSGWLPKRGFDAKFAAWIHAAFQRRSLNFRRSSPMTKPARNIWSAFGGHRDFRAPNAVR